RRSQRSSASCAPEAPAGQLMAFDNQRVLHGRTACTTGARHLQGCYVDKDSLHSRIRVLEAAR
ncbi:MAG: TauD/TfdA family dioxygenase, partial [Acidimicrobiales bacterium]|nr:TauD/TfdA family dioxygenase [Acidimicrobiales bacterium]